MPSDWARALAAATPTRSPVKSPGPTSTATAPRSPGTRPTWRSRCSSAGVRVSTWRRRPVSANSASTPAGVRTATPTVSVAVSMATSAGTRSPGPGPVLRAGPPRRAHAASRPSAASTSAARRSQFPRPAIESSRRGRRARRVGGDEGDLECALAEGGDGEVPPLDEGDGVLFHQLGQGEIGDLGHRAGAVDVGVDELGDRQRRARSGSDAPARRSGWSPGPATPSAAAKPWAKTVLPAPRSPTRSTTSPARHRPARRPASSGSPRATPWRAAGASSRARRRHEPLGPHEVGPHLGHGFAPGPQHIGRVVRRHEGGTAPLEDLAAQLADAPRALEEELGGEVPQGDDDGSGRSARSAPRDRGDTPRSRRAPDRGSAAGGT